MYNEALAFCMHVREVVQRTLELSTDRISLTSLPFCFESTDIKVTDGFTALVKNTGLGGKLKSGGLGRPESECARDIVEIAFVCKLHGPTD